MICELAGQIGGVASGKGVETHTVSSYRVVRSRPVIWCVAGSKDCRGVVCSTTSTAVVVFTTASYPLRGIGCSRKVNSGG